MYARTLKTLKNAITAHFKRIAKMHIFKESEKHPLPMPVLYNWVNHMHSVHIIHRVIYPGPGSGPGDDLDLDVELAVDWPWLGRGAGRGDAQPHPPRITCMRARCRLRNYLNFLYIADP